MNRVVKGILVGAGALLCIVAIGLSFASDHTAPVITVGENAVTYEQNGNLDVLLQGVTANDNRDGNVTKSLMVESITVLEDTSRAQVFYVARDSRNNVSRESRVVNYAAAEPAAQTKAAEETSTERDTEAATAPVILLESDEVSVLKGSTFSATSYILKITDDKDTSANLMKRVTVNGTCDTSKTGDYTLQLSCTDSNNNQSARKTLTVHVVE